MQGHTCLVFAGLCLQDMLFQIKFVSVGIQNVCSRSISRAQIWGRLGGPVQGHTCLAFAVLSSPRCALSNYVCFSRYLKCMSQVNFKGPDFGASGRGNAGAHKSGICIFIISKMCSFKLSRFQLVPRTHVPGQFQGGHFCVWQGQCRGPHVWHIHILQCDNQPGDMALHLDGTLLV